MDDLVDCTIKQIKLICSEVFVNPTVEILTKKFPTITWWQLDKYHTEEERKKHFKIIQDTKTIYQAARNWINETPFLKTVIDRNKFIASISLRKYCYGDEWLWACISHHIFALEYYEADLN